MLINGIACGFTAAWGWNLGGLGVREPELARDSDSQREMQELSAKMAALEADNAKVRRYATRAKQEIGKLQAERKRNAADLATSEFKLKEAMAGRGVEANKMLEAGSKNEKTDKMKEWESKHGKSAADTAEAKLRAQHSANSPE